MINLTDLPHDITLHRVFEPKEAAAFLGLTDAQLRQLKCEGAMPEPLYFSERRYKWRIGDLIQYLDDLDVTGSGWMYRYRAKPHFILPGGREMLGLMQ